LQAVDELFGSVFDGQQSVSSDATTLQFGQDVDVDVHPDDVDTPPWHAEWTVPMVNILSNIPGNTLGFLDNVVLDYAGDCSGAEAPLWALNGILETLRNLSGINVTARHMFSSEHPKNQAAKTFLQLNHKPMHLFNDMIVGTSGIAAF
jgi:hypothetical protein